MKILLDIDGVMVTTPPWRSVEILEDGFSTFNPKAAANLSNILIATNASIVLTTSHKSSFSIENWVNIFRNRGIRLLTMDRLPESINFSTRKDEVMNWLEQSGEKNFVIIDDDKSLNDLPDSIKSKLVLTDYLIGLDENKSMQAINILNRHNS